MRIRADDDVELTPHIKKQRQGVAFNRDVSLADAVALVGLAGTIIWTAAIIQADTRANTNDIAGVKHWIEAHSAADTQNDQLIDQRLRNIEEKLDTMIGEVRGERKRSHP